MGKIMSVGREEIELKYELAPGSSLKNKRAFVYFPL
jgi:hypothetical protein